MLSSGELLPWPRCRLLCHLGARTWDRAPQNTLGFGTPALLPAAEGCQHLQQHCKQILTRRNARSKTATGGAQLGASVPPHSAAPCSNLALSDNISSLVLSTPAICFTFTPCYPIPPALHCTRLLNSSVCICPHQTRADPTTEAARTCNRVRQRLSRVPFKKIKTKKHAICTELGCICY